MKTNNVTLTIGVSSLLMLAGCSLAPPTVIVKPGYYQQGRFLSAENVGPYYDSLGHFYPKRTIAARYQPGRWHHAQYRNLAYENNVYPTPDDVSLMAADADLP